MRKFIIFTLLAAIAQWTMAETVTLHTSNTTMVLNVEKGKQPKYVYYGAKLSDYDLQHLQTPRNGRMDAYPAYGMNCPAEAAFAMKHADGNMSTELYVTDLDRQGDITRITLKDPIYPISVTLFYKVYQEARHPNTVCFLFSAYPSWQRMALSFLWFLGQ